MKMMIIPTLMVLAINLFVWGVLIYLVILLIKALKKYISSSDTRNEQSIIKRTLGESIKAYRTSNNMTQEFVAECLGVSRQAVSKWESGASEPSTSNLLALAKLFHVSVEDLLKEVNL